MARSRRHTPIFGITTARSEKRDKRFANRKFRRRERVALQQGRECPVRMEEVSNIWSHAKDGKTFWASAPSEMMRK